MNFIVKEEKEEPGGSPPSTKRKIQRLSASLLTDTFLGTFNRGLAGTIGKLTFFQKEIPVKIEIFAGLLSLEPPPGFELCGRKPIFVYGESH